MEFIALNIHKWSY